MKVPSYAQVDTVEVEGARFELAPIPDGVWRGLALKASAYNRAAKRRALLDLKSAGEDISEEAVAHAAFLDGAYRNELEALKRETVAWGVRGHQVEGLTFQPEEREYFGKKYAGASASTVNDYADTRLDAGGVLLDWLYLEVSRKNSLTPMEKKSSGQPSETTGDGGGVKTA